MKQFRKVIAVVLAFILVSSLALPTFVFAAEEIANEEAVVADDGHTTPDEFWDEKVNEDGSVNWDSLSTNLFNFTFIVKFFESIMSFFRDSVNTIFGFLAWWVPEIPDVPVEDVVEDTSFVAEDTSFVA